MLKAWGLLLASLILSVATVFASPHAEGAAAIRVCGSGFGHGVGLSQYGAYGRAKAGQGYAQIIKAYYQGVELKQYASNPTVRVLLGDRNLDSTYDVIVHAGSEARLRNLATGDAVALDPASYRVRYLADTGRYRVTDLSTGKKVGSYRGPVRFERVSGRFLGFGGRDYRGSFEVNTSGSKLYLVNRLRMESYVRGVISNEMSYSWPQSALESQAVAARSFAYATRRSGVFDFYADTRSQVYGGMSSETGPTDAAVRGTQRVVAAHDGEPIVAFFHSSSGGYTEDASYVFSPSPYLKAVEDVDTQGEKFEAKAGSPWLHWTGTLDPNGSSQLGIGSIESVRVMERSPSGRATKIEVTGTSGTKTISGESNIRFGLKTNGLKLANGSSYSAGNLPSARVSFGSACG